MTAPHAEQAQVPVTVRTFSQRLSATRRGARLARRLAVQQLDAWGIPYGSELSDAAALVVAELAANAVLHGRVPGRDIALHLTYGPDAIRVELADARGECLPRLLSAAPPAPGADSDGKGGGPAGADGGRGLLLVDALATRWGIDTEPGPGKRVWAELGPVNSCPVNSCPVNSCPVNARPGSSRTGGNRYRGPS